MRDLAERIVELVRSHPEFSLAMAGRMAPRSPALRHDFQVAVVAALVAQAMDISLAQQQTVVRTALAMNLSSCQLHDDLAKSQEALNVAQRINIARHPILAAELLSYSPGADLQWIEAVEQHHESMDGTGYPFGLLGKELCIEARVVKVADLWCALVSSRPTRMGKSPQHAMQELQTRERMRVDMSVLAAMRRRLGNYPPGTLVRLSSHETAVVTGFTHGNAAPRHVIAILNAAGEVIAKPVVRDTGKTAYVIRGHTQLSQFQTRMPDWERVWALSYASSSTNAIESKVA
ncbi:MAG: HD domain-containing protein [Sterolibacterium sp.]|nr:HD domain-containing protein [Sterolibacterium sp.]